MKLSVSVPDALWETSRAQRPDLNPSRLVQEALEAWRQQRARPAFPLERPVEADSLFAKRRDQLAAKAREEFERGYRAALAVAEVFDWWDLESLARQRFDVAAWAAGFADAAVAADLGRIPTEAPDKKVMSALIKALGALLPPFGDNEPTPSAPYQRGFAQAMRELWRESFEGTASQPENPEPRPEPKSDVGKPLPSEEPIRAGRVGSSSPTGAPAGRTAGD